MAHLMTWFRESVMSTRLKLFSDTLAAMYTPMAAMPFHCFSSVAWCLLLKGSRSMKGRRTQKLKAIWQVVNNSGNVKP